MSSPTSYMKRYTLERHQGVQHRVAPDRAAAHLTALHDGGMTWREIARAAGASAESAPRHVIQAAREGWTINRATEASWLAVKPAPTTTRRGSLKRTPEVGTMRRVQALAALGWTLTALEAEMGVSLATLGYISRGKHNASGASALHIRAGYERLCMTVPTGPQADRRRTTARRAGWPPPLAWDDIDNPSERPKHGERPRKAAA